MTADVAAVEDQLLAMQAAVDALVRLAQDGALAALTALEVVDFCAVSRVCATG